MAKALDEILAAAGKLGEAEGADVLFFNGEIMRGVDHRFIETVLDRKRRKKIILIIVTPGGDADAAYRVGRVLQKSYDDVTIFITGWCKSAGTLIALAAHRLVFSDFGELGPLDVQLGKQDNLFDYGSGLDIEAALRELELASWGMFEDVMLAIERASSGRVMFRTAAEMSSDLVGRLFGNLYSQIDPMQIGENSRLMTVARDYGKRLSETSGNLRSDSSLELLVSSYASHGFVIDLDEAGEIFKEVVAANEDFDRLRMALGDMGLTPISTAQDGEVMLSYLNKEITDDPEPEASNDGGLPGDGGAGGEGGEAPTIPVENSGSSAPADAPEVAEPSNGASAAPEASYQ